MKNLNPCPICGGKAKFKSKRTHKKLGTIGTIQERYIKCENCGARTHAFGKIDNVINAWQLGQVY